MKKILLVAAMALFSFGVQAQVNVEEPEFSEETLLLTSDATAIKLPRESSKLKAKASASMYIVGIGKVKSRITIGSPKSPVQVDKQPSGEYRFIIKAESNSTDPKSFLSFFKFEQKSNRRQAQVGEAGTFSGSEENSLSNYDFVAKKYGKSSYLIKVSGLDSGEYGILIGDPEKLSQKNSFMVTTFGIK